MLGGLAYSPERCTGSFESKRFIVINSVPGPWEVIDADPRYFGIWQAGEGGERLAQVEKRSTNSKSTAHLINAAPELYAALDALREAWECLADSERSVSEGAELIDRGKELGYAALSKANGENE